MNNIIENAYITMMKSRRNAAFKKSLPTVYDGKVDLAPDIPLNEDASDLHNKLRPEYPDRSKFFHLAATYATLAEKHAAKKTKIAYHDDPVIQDSEKHIDSIIDEHLHHPLVSVKVGQAIEERSNGNWDHRDELRHRYGYVMGRHADIGLPRVEDGHQTRFSESELQHHHVNGFIPYGNGVFRHKDVPLWVNANFQHKDGEYHQVRGENAKTITQLKNTPEYAKVMMVHTKLSQMRLKPEYSSDSIAQYTHDSAELNRQLIEQHLHGTPVEHPNRMHAEELSHVIKNNSHPGRDFDAYTGLSKRINLRSIMDQHKGKPTVAVHFPAFTSTSLDKTTAEGFAGIKQEPKPYLRNGVMEVLHMKIPSDHKRGLYVDHMSDNPGEHEYLLDKSHVVHIPQQEPMYEFKHGNATRHYSGYIHPNGEHDD